MFLKFEFLDVSRKCQVHRPCFTFLYHLSILLSVLSEFDLFRVKTADVRWRLQRTNDVIKSIISKIVLKM